METSALLRDVVREYVRSQRRSADCGDTASTVECHILSELLRTEPVTQQELADRLMLDKGWISRGVDRLAAAGAVVRLPDPLDRRRVRLRLSDAGRSRAGALEARLHGHAHSCLAGLAPEQERQLAGLLGHVLARLRGAACGSPCQPAGVALLFRPARSSDRAAIVALLRAADLPVDDLPDDLASFTVGLDASAVMAVGGLVPYGRDALLRSFVVAERMRGQGQGGQLLLQVLRQARTAGVEQAYLLTQTAEAFFARHGFHALDRGAAPDHIRRTRQFTELCPASATLMGRSLSPLEDSAC